MPSVTRSQSNRAAKGDSQRRSTAQTVSRTGKENMQQTPDRTGKTNFQGGDLAAVARPRAGETVINKTTTANPIGRRYASPIGPAKPDVIPTQGRSIISYVTQLKNSPVPAAPAPAKKALAAVKRTPTVINIPGGGLRVGAAKAAAPTRMGVNRVTGNTTGFSSGKTTGSTVSKAGTAIRTNTSAFSRAQQNAFNKGGVAGPSRSSGGGSRSSSSSSGSRSTGGGTSRGDVGAGRRGGGR